MKRGLGQTLVIELSAFAHAIPPLAVAVSMSSSTDHSRTFTPAAITRSAAALGEAETALFIGLIGSLLDGRFSHGATAHPSGCRPRRCRFQ
jgi:hypothetical protein